MIFSEKNRWKLSTSPLTQTESKQHHGTIKLDKKQQKEMVGTEIRYSKSIMPHNLLYFRESSPGN